MGEPKVEKTPIKAEPTRLSAAECERYFDLIKNQLDVKDIPQLCKGETFIEIDKTSRTVYISHPIVHKLRKEGDDLFTISPTAVSWARCEDGSNSCTIKKINRFSGDFDATFIGRTTSNCEYQERRSFGKQNDW